VSPAISVVITCYNLERYIGPAIESVLAQDIPEPFEVIVVDDCSGDGSEATIRSYSDVRYFKTKSNSGVLLAMLDGIRQTSGELIFLLDGDDLWEPGKLTHSVGQFRADPNCALTSHDLVFVDEAGRLIARGSKPEQVLSKLTPSERSSRMVEGILHHLDFVWLGSALGVHRERADLAGFDRWARQLPDPANTYQDWPLAFWVASLPDIDMSYSPEKLFRYRLHSANYSGDVRTASRAARNFTRARNTLEAMWKLAVERTQPAEVIDKLRRRSLANDYRARLYSGKRMDSLSSLPKALPDFMHEGVLIKELVRFAGAQLLGASRFARLSSSSSVKVRGTTK